MADLIAGKIEVTANGRTINAFGNFVCQHGGEANPKHEGMLNGKGVLVGKKATFVIPSITGEMRVAKGVNVKRDIFDMDDATVVAILATGKKFMIEGAYYSGDKKLKTEDGTCPFEVQGKTSTEID